MEQLVSFSKDYSLNIPSKSVSPQFKSISQDKFCWPYYRLAIAKGDLSIIDLRSPKEFLLGSIPQAINLPLLDDQERHDVGSAYKNGGKTLATQLGVEFFSRKVDYFLSKIQEHASPERKIVLHCWRGGLRSLMVSKLISAIGYEPIVLAGGYKQFRKTILDTLDQFSRHSLIVLNGRTGSGKTGFLHKLPDGFPLMDFEGLARHRGSAFGDFFQNSASPTQQNFENMLADQYLSLGSFPKILVEIENFIGPVTLPAKLRKTIDESPMILIERDFDDRVERLAKIYVCSWSAYYQDLFEKRMQLLKKHLSDGERERIIGLTRKGDFKTAIASLLAQHYDRLYDRSIKKHQTQFIARFNLSHQEKEALETIKQLFNFPTVVN